jgi:hypothetical protein
MFEISLSLAWNLVASCELIGELAAEAKRRLEEAHQ